MKCHPSHEKAMKWTQNLLLKINNYTSIPFPSLTRKKLVLLTPKFKQCFYVDYASVAMDYHF